MNDTDMRNHLLARRKQLQDQIAPLCAGLAEVEAMLRLVAMPTALPVAGEISAPEVRRVKGGDVILKFLADAGTSGLSATEAAILMEGAGFSPKNAGARLSTLKNEGTVSRVNGRYVMKKNGRAGHV